MRRQHTYSRRGRNGILFLLVYILIGLYSCVDAQSFQRITHSGLEISSGVHGFCPGALAQSKLRGITRGISAGVVTGNNLVRFRIKPLGYFRSTKIRDREFGVIESELLMNFYPLEFLRTRKQILDIYTIMGLTVNNIFFDKQNMWQPAAADPETRSFEKMRHVTSFNQTAGIGVELHLPSQFVHLFAEAMFANAVYRSVDNRLFDDTIPKTKAIVNLGIRVGTRKVVKAPRHYPG